MPFAAFVDQRTGANGANDPLGGGNDGLGFLDNGLQRVDAFGAASLVEAGGAGVAAERIGISETEFADDTFGSTPMHEFVFDFFAVGMTADSTFASVAFPFGERGRGLEGFFAGGNASAGFLSFGRERRITAGDFSKDGRRGFGCENRFRLWRVERFGRGRDMGSGAWRGFGGLLCRDFGGHFRCHLRFDACFGTVFCGNYETEMGFDVEIRILEGGEGKSAIKIARFSKWFHFFGSPTQASTGARGAVLNERTVEGQN